MVFEQSINRSIHQPGNGQGSGATVSPAPNVMVQQGASANSETQPCHRVTALGAQSYTYPNRQEQLLNVPVISSCLREDVGRKPRRRTSSQSSSAPSSKEEDGEHNAGSLPEDRAKGGVCGGGVATGEQARGGGGPNREDPSQSLNQKTQPAKVAEEGVYSDLTHPMVICNNLRHPITKLTAFGWTLCPNKRQVKKN